MLNINELEYRWMRYKIKSYIPHFTILLSLTVIILISINFFTNNKDNNTSTDIQLQKELPIIETTLVKTSPTDIIKKRVQEEKKTLQVKPHRYKENSQLEKKKVNLAPSLDFMKKMQNSVQPYYKTENSSIRQEDVKPKRLKEKVETNREIYEVESSFNQEHKVQIRRKNTQNDISQVIKRFEKNNNPVLSLFVAKKYYEIGKYRDSYDYALKTNNLDKNIDQSWIIFSKSLVKMGKKDRAIKTLKTYIKYSHSINAQTLLNEIKTGKFR